MVQRQLFTSALLGSLCFLATACGQPKATAPPPAARVKLAAVQTETLSQTAVYNASLQSRESITLQPQVSGRIAQINVQNGQFVTQGQPLLLIDPSEQQAVVASNLAAIQSAQANVENARSILRALEAQRRSNLATVEFNRIQAERYTALFEEGAVSKEQAQSFITSFRTAQAALQQTEGDIRAQQATIAQLEKVLLAAQANAQQQAVVLNWFQVRAPFSGVVGNIPPKVGDFVTPQTDLLTLTSNQPLEVYIQVPIEQIPRIRMGTPVELIDMNGNVVGTSSVFFIAPNTTNNTQTILVKALYDNTRNNLRADQQIQARIILDQQPGILVPTTAVSNLAGQNFVFVAEKDAEGKMIAKQKPIQVGAIQGNRYQVFEGLKPGEQIVVSGIQRLRDGVPITPES
ncbi:efflux RND transporter periplasmic adaptor subunit [Thermosynechococcus sp. QKsg1]|uniref:efflux RND transporter periplasmic adaptor subunit n=1 Tax=unclassified Thermosynechococcus TaxID=2622553 RepID=UPI00122DE9A8|nr:MULTISPECIES: efflux RND transporter periplasmic adaptor subunit [unclassified Thermosynechococcus]QEQ01424.1 efflux RND transporter periplasmic adaptor subunit [Thermosynechococcus sp. CL-1]WNC85895.1 efflux RND transporter periplasmic adaptor subunit [Thermosynechococcus sp. QKsg1]